MSNVWQKIGYCRVSTEDQNPTLQIEALKSAGCQRIFFTDAASGATTQRPHLQRYLKTLTEGDSLIVWKLDRLGRSLKDLIMLLYALTLQGVAFQSLTESIDTTTPTGRAMWQMMGILAELERSLIKERTKAARKAAIAKGVKMRRKPILSPRQIAHVRELSLQGKPRSEIMKLFNISKEIFYRYLKSTVL